MLATPICFLLNFHPQAASAIGRLAAAICRDNIILNCGFRAFRQVPEKYWFKGNRAANQQLLTAQFDVILDMTIQSGRFVPTCGRYPLLSSSMAEHPA